MKQAVGDYYATFAVQPWLLQSIDTVTNYMKIIFKFSEFFNSRFDCLNFNFNLNLNSDGPLVA